MKNLHAFNITLKLKRMLKSSNSNNMYMFAFFCDYDNSCRVNMDNVPIEVREMFQMSMNLGDAIIDTVINQFSCLFFNIL